MSGCTQDGVGQTRRDSFTEMIQAMDLTYPWPWDPALYDPMTIIPMSDSCTEDLEPSNDFFGEEFQAIVQANSCDPSDSLHSAIEDLNDINWDDYSPRKLVTSHLDMPLPVTLKTETGHEYFKPGVTDWIDWENYWTWLLSQPDDEIDRTLGLGDFLDSDYSDYSDYFDYSDYSDYSDSPSAAADQPDAYECDADKDISHLSDFDSTGPPAAADQPDACEYADKDISHLKLAQSSPLPVPFSIGLPPAPPPAPGPPLRTLAPAPAPLRIRNSTTCTNHPPPAPPAKLARLRGYDRISFFAALSEAFSNVNIWSKASLW
ncbi:hypothetical protein V8E54_013421 [Elaphomyces granulatus]